MPSRNPGVRPTCPQSLSNLPVFGPGVFCQQLIASLDLTRSRDTLLFVEATLFVAYERSP